MYDKLDGENFLSEESEEVITLLKSEKGRRYFSYTLRRLPCIERCIFIQYYGLSAKSPEEIDDESLNYDEISGAFDFKINAKVVQSIQKSTISLLRSGARMLKRA